MVKLKCSYLFLLPQDLYYLRYLISRWDKRKSQLSSNHVDMQVAN